jgi:hypothetical protein
LRCQTAEGLTRLDRLIAEKRAWNLHGVIVVRDGRLVLERCLSCSW